jgi:hypothetical protein
MFRRSLVTVTAALLPLAAAPTALAAQNTGVVRPASLPSKDSWGPWFKAPSANYSNLKCRFYASVTAGSQIRFRAYVECNHKEPFSIFVNGLQNGHVTKSRGRACSRQTWCDVVYKVNNKKGKQTWCTVVGSYSIGSYYLGPKDNPRKPGVTS